MSEFPTGSKRGYVVDRKNGKEGVTLAWVDDVWKRTCHHRTSCQFQDGYVDMSHLVGDERYHDRLTYDGRWKNNLYQFFHRVLPKLSMDLPRPFVLEGVRRVDDAPQHRAVREAFTNSIIHCDVFLSGGVLRIDKYDDRLCFRNPGILKLPIEQVYEGGTSKARNPKMQNILRMIGYGENLGSGFPKIISAWKQAGWKEPLLENRLDLDKVRLTLFVPFENSDEGGQKVDQKMNQKDCIEQVFTYIQSNPNITREELIVLIGKSASSVKRYIEKLKQNDRIRRIGGDKGGHWKI